MNKILMLVIGLAVSNIAAQSSNTAKTTVRPYQFGFSIEEQQHRYEKRDERGIVMGEFGFITADGIYHVTVYATDEEGKFRILAMKNYPYKDRPTVTRTALDVVVPISTTTAATTTTVNVPKPIDPVRKFYNAEACSGCSLLNGKDKNPDIDLRTAPPTGSIADNEILKIILAESTKQTSGKQITQAIENTLTQLSKANLITPLPVGTQTLTITPTQTQLNTIVAAATQPGTTFIYTNTPSAQQIASSVTTSTKLSDADKQKQQSEFNAYYESIGNAAESNVASSGQGKRKYVLVPNSIASVSSSSGKTMQTESNEPLETASSNIIVLGVLSDRSQLSSQKFPTNVLNRATGSDSGTVTTATASALTTKLTPFVQQQNQVKPVESYLKDVRATNIGNLSTLLSGTAASNLATLYIKQQLKNQTVNAFIQDKLNTFNDLTSAQQATAKNPKRQQSPANSLVLQPINSVTNTNTLNGNPKAATEGQIFNDANRNSNVDYKLTDSGKLKASVGQTGSTKLNSAFGNNNNVRFEPSVAANPFFGNPVAIQANVAANSKPTAAAIQDNKTAGSQQAGESNTNRNPNTASTDERPVLSIAPYLVKAANKIAGQILRPNTATTNSAQKDEINPFFGNPVATQANVAADLRPTAAAIQDNKSAGSQQAGVSNTNTNPNTASSDERPVLSIAPYLVKAANKIAGQILRPNTATINSAQKAESNPFFSNRDIGQAKPAVFNAQYADLVVASSSFGSANAAINPFFSNNGAFQSSAATNTQSIQKNPINSFSGNRDAAQSIAGQGSNSNGSPSAAFNPFFGNKGAAFSGNGGPNAVFENREREITLAASNKQVSVSQGSTSVANNPFFAAAGATDAIRQSSANSGTILSVGNRGTAESRIVFNAQSGVIKPVVALGGNANGLLRPGPNSSSGNRGTQTGQYNLDITRNNASKGSIEPSIGVYSAVPGNEQLNGGSNNKNGLNTPTVPLGSSSSFNSGSKYSVANRGIERFSDGLANSFNGHSNENENRKSQGNRNAVEVQSGSVSTSAPANVNAASVAANGNAAFKNVLNTPSISLGSSNYFNSGSSNAPAKTQSGQNKGFAYSPNASAASNQPLASGNVANDRNTASSNGRPSFGSVPNQTRESTQTLRPNTNTLSNTQSNTATTTPTQTQTKTQQNHQLTPNTKNPSNGQFPATSTQQGNSPGSAGPFSKSNTPTNGNGIKAGNGPSGGNSNGNNNNKQNEVDLLPAIMNSIVPLVSNTANTQTGDSSKGTNAAGRVDTPSRVNGKQSGNGLVGTINSKGGIGGIGSEGGIGGVGNTSDNTNKATTGTAGDLYRFKYVLDYNGHQETGSHNGDKEGSYFVIGENNVEHNIEYVANEFGYQPRIHYRKLDAADEAQRPKENTLKEYEFIWFNKKEQN